MSPDGPVGHRLSRVARWAVLAALTVVPFVALAPLDYATGTRFTDLLTVLVGGSAIGIPYLARRVGLANLRDARKLFAGAAVLAVVVAVTGLFNGQTFEPYTTPRYAGLVLAGQNPYATPLTFTFTECAGPTAHAWIACTVHASATFYVYLPLLMFVQVPFAPYALTTLLAWVGVVYLVRDRFWALLALGNPFVGLAAANGYNDFPALLVLTVGLVATDPRVRHIAQGLATGFKQFANVLLLGYYLLTRQHRAALASLVVAAAFLAPFVLLDPRAVGCTVLLHETATCTPGSGADLLSHLNYWLWPLWVVAMFPDWIAARTRRIMSAFRGQRTPGARG